MCTSLLLAFVGASFLAAATSPTDWKPVEQALGRAGSVQPGGVYKAGFPRSDLAVTAEGVAVKPALALGSWAAFKKSGGHTMVMGDLVLLESELNPVISALQAGGIEQSAVHNHLIGESPHVMYVHFSGHGDAVALARTLHDALALTKTPMAPPASATNAPPLDLPVADLDRILGQAGKANGGVYQFSIARPETIREKGMEIPPAMGTATAINFQPVGGGRAAISGDFVMIAAEVNPVIRALRGGGILVTALHSHMLGESPRLFFMHFWAVDDARKLAATLRTALDRMHVTQRAFILAGERIAFDADLAPHFTDRQNRESALETRTGFARWAATENGRRLIARFNAQEYEIVVAENSDEVGAGRAPQPALATLVAANDRAALKSYAVILNPAFHVPKGKIVFPTSQPATQTDMMAAAWAGEMLHVDFYSRGISLPHHQRADFQEEWRVIAGQLGYPDMKHEDGDERAIRVVATH